MRGDTCQTRGAGVKCRALPGAGIRSRVPFASEAAALMAKPPMLRWFYMFMANFGMRGLAKKHRAKARLYDRPYAA